MNPSQPRKRRYVGIVVSLLLWAVVILGFLQRQAIYDWWRLRDYDPPAVIAQLATDTTMNDPTRRLFYVYHPIIEPKESFNSHCRDGEFTIVLGCYVQNQGIYLFRVDDERLKGVEEVTAAHETLHAAYDRLSRKDREQVDTWTAEAFAALNNQRIKDTIEQYRKSDPSVVPNELHSILGTEVRDLPAELENYYKQYFTDRKRIVDFSEAYEAAFSSRQAQAKAYEAQLKSLQTAVEAANKELEAESKSLAQRYQALEQQRGSAEPAKFNAEVDSYNQAVRAYNQKVARTSSQIDQYNKLYEQYKQVVLEQQSLFSAIDSRPQTLQTQ